jgi:hypothetical protein
MIAEAYDTGVTVMPKLKGNRHRYVVYNYGEFEKVDTRHNYEWYMKTLHKAVKLTEQMKALEKGIIRTAFDKEQNAPDFDLLQYHVGNAMHYLVMETRKYVCTMMEKYPDKYDEAERCLDIINAGLTLLAPPRQLIQPQQQPEQQNVRCIV